MICPRRAARAGAGERAAVIRGKSEPCGARAAVLRAAGARLEANLYQWTPRCACGAEPRPQLPDRRAGDARCPTADTYNAIRNSFQTWAAVSCSDLMFPEEPLSTSSQARLVGYFQNQANHNLVLWRTKACHDVVPANDPCLTQGGCSNAYDCWDGTLHGDSGDRNDDHYRRSLTGEILDTDIELNDAPSSTGSKFTFTTVDGLPAPRRRRRAACASTCRTRSRTRPVTRSASITRRIRTRPCTTARLRARPASASWEPTTSPASARSTRARGHGHLPRAGQLRLRLFAQGQNGPGAALGALALLLHIRRRSRSRPQLAIQEQHESGCCHSLPERQRELKPEQQEGGDDRDHQRGGEPRDLAAGELHRMFLLLRPGDLRSGRVPPFRALDEDAHAIETPQHARAPADLSRSGTPARAAGRSSSEASPAVDRLLRLGSERSEQAVQTQSVAA